MSVKALGEGLSSVQVKISDYQNQIANLSAKFSNAPSPPPSNKEITFEVSATEIILVHSIRERLYPQVYLMRNDAYSVYQRVYFIEYNLLVLTICARIRLGIYFALSTC